MCWTGKRLYILTQMSEKNRVYLETRYRCMGYRLWSPCQSIFGDRHLQRLSTKMTFFNRFQHPLAQPTVEKEKAVTIVIDLDAMTEKKTLNVYTSGIEFSDAINCYTLISHGLLATIQASSVFQNWATTALSTCRR